MCVCACAVCESCNVFHILSHQLFFVPLAQGHIAPIYSISSRVPHLVLRTYAGVSTLRGSGDEEGDGGFLPRATRSSSPGGASSSSGSGTPQHGGAPGTWSPQWGWYVSMTPPQVSDVLFLCFVLVFCLFFVFCSMFISLSLPYTLSTLCLDVLSMFFVCVYLLEFAHRLEICL